MEKNKFIAEKIQKLVQSGKDRNKAISMAYDEYEGMQKMQEGSMVAYNEPRTYGIPRSGDINSRLKNIDYIQSGVNNDSRGSGYYVNNSDGTREFVTQDAYNTTMSDTPQLQEYLKSSGGIGRHIPGTEDKVYKPIETNPKYNNSHLQKIDYIRSGVNSDKKGQGYYFNYNKGTRDFVSEQAYKNNKGQTAVQEYLKSSGGIDRHIPGTEDKIYRPSFEQGGEIKYMQTGGFVKQTKEEMLKDLANVEHLRGAPMTQEEINTDALNITGQGTPYTYKPDRRMRRMIEEDSNKSIMSKEEYDRIRLANLYGGDMNPQMYGYGLGRAIDKKDGLGAVVNGLGLGLGTVKNVLSGMGDSRMSEYAYNKYREDQIDDSSEYKPAMQQGGYIPQLKKKQSDEPQVDNQNVDRTNAEMLTGEYLTEDPNGQNNVEIEKNEKVLHADTGEVQTAEGAKHKDGGIKATLAEGSQVLSDYTKTGAKNAKYFSDIFNIKAEAGDTFAKTLDRIETKIGLKKLLKEEEELNLKIEKELQKQNPDEQTQNLNMQLLSEHSQEINKKKEEIEGIRKIAFQELFEKQELIPKKGSPGEILKQEGGSIGQEQPNPQQILEAYAESIQKDPRELMQMLQQMSAEKQQEALSQMYQALQQGAQNPQEEQAEGQMSNPQEEQQEMKRGGAVNPAKNSYVSDMIHKLMANGVSHYDAVGQAIDGWDKMQEGGEMQYMEEGDTVGDPEVLTREQIVARNMATGSNSAIPSLGGAGWKDPYYNPYSQYEKYLGRTPRDIKTHLDYQSGVMADLNPQVIRLVKDGYMPLTNKHRSILAKQGVKNSDKKISFSDLTKEQKDKFTDKEIADGYTDGLAGYRGVKIIQGDMTQEQYKNSTGNYNHLTDTAGRQVYAKYDSKGGLEKDTEGNYAFYYPKEDPTLDKKASEATTPEATVTATEEAQKAKGNRPDRLVVPNIPTYYGQAPTPPEPVYKGDISLDRLNPTKISIEPNLVEAQRQMMGAQGSLEGLSPTQRAVAIQNMYTQNQGATNQAISQAQIANDNSQRQVDMFNIGQSGKERLTNLNNALSFEQRNLGGKAKYEANLNRYFNNIAAVDKQNWQDVNNLNYINAKSDNFQTDGTNFYRSKEDPSIYNSYGGAGFSKFSENDQLAILKKQVADKEKAIKASIKKNA